jgi:hypothetical protein
MPIMLSEELPTENALNAFRGVTNEDDLSGCRGVTDIGNYSETRKDILCLTSLKPERASSVCSFSANRKGILSVTPLKPERASSVCSFSET